MPDDNQMLAARIDRFEKTITDSINRMSGSITHLAQLMAEKTANDKHVENKLEDVKMTISKQDERLRAVEDYITTKTGMQKYMDFFWRAVITVVATSMVGGVAWAVAKSLGVF